MAKNHVTTTINNEPVEFLCDTHETMLDVLRNDLGLTGSKEGCGSGDCGACTIMVDGRLACACLMLGAEAEGRTSPTKTSVFLNATIEGVVLLPSALVITVGSPPYKTATTLFVVPKSIPTALPMNFSFLN